MRHALQASTADGWPLNAPPPHPPTPPAACLLVCRDVVPYQSQYLHHHMLRDGDDVAAYGGRGARRRRVGPAPPPAASFAAPQRPMAHPLRRCWSGGSTLGLPQSEAVLALARRVRDAVTYVPSGGSQLLPREGCSSVWSEWLPLPSHL